MTLPTKAPCKECGKPGTPYNVVGVSLGPLCDTCYRKQKNDQIARYEQYKKDWAKQA